MFLSLVSSILYFPNKSKSYLTLKVSVSTGNSGFPALLPLAALPPAFTLAPRTNICKYGNYH